MLAQGRWCCRLPNRPGSGSPPGPGEGRALLRLGPDHPDAACELSIRRHRAELRAGCTSHGSIGEVIDLLRDARGEGRIRADVDSEGVLVLLRFLSRLDESEATERTHHVLDLIVDGVCA